MAMAGAMPLIFRFVRPKKCFLCGFLCLFICGVLFAGLARVSPAKRANIHGPANGTNVHKFILAWTTKSGKTKWIPNTLKSLNCPVSNCKISEDRSTYGQADAIIFHAKDVADDDLPPTEFNRSSKTWVLLNHEPPPQTNRHVYSFMNSQIDWTVSYRRDSTIFAPIYEVLAKPRGSPNYKLLPKRDKRKVSTWLVSHCATAGNREGFVAELKRYMPVDVWGKCGRKLTSCPPGSRQGCYEILGRKYKFYLSLENSICLDYVTEKAYLALKAGMIPIVFGGADYSRFLPPGSYIDALAFQNVRELARHIQTIARNRRSLMKYLEWKKGYEIVERRYKWLCDLCKKLNSDVAVPVKSNAERMDLTGWWYAESKCQQWRNGTLRESY